MLHRHFCADEGVDEAARTVREMWQDVGLRSILDYGMEDADDGAACDRNLAGFLRAVEMASSPPFASEQKDPSFRLPWKAHSFSILCHSSPLYLTPHEPEPLIKVKEHDLRLALRRLSTICARCTQANIPLLIDAEYSSVQLAIDYFTYSAMREFNCNEQPIVYNTIQTYLRDAKERMANVVEAVEEDGFSLGIKLVRGAYLTRETQLASSMGGPSLIHGSIQETHECFDSCASFMMERVSRKAKERPSLESPSKWSFPEPPLLLFHCFPDPLAAPLGVCFFTGAMVEPRPTSLDLRISLARASASF
ncbi:hypothetical protein ZIOFF_000643 [Zingiber officinale]|uniref:Proline dehydrogenase n=1 Tax=Zingiber officinale TaxID=94328 RepID=A0A8J5LXZ9_ZINOF|nr:hypothetical protein ZIOFF_000643 [Zingiber officinale]